MMTKDSYVLPFRITIEIVPQQLIILPATLLLCSIDSLLICSTLSQQFCCLRLLSLGSLLHSFEYFR